MSGLSSRLPGHGGPTARPWPSSRRRHRRPEIAPAATRRRAGPRRDRPPDPVARDPDDPRGQPRPAEPRRDQGRRPPGVERLGRLDPDRALLPLAAARRPRRGQAARLARLSTRSSTCSATSTRSMLTRLREFGGLQSYPSPHEGPRPGRLLDRARSASARSRRSSRPSPIATCELHFHEHDRPAPGPAVRRAGRRRRARRGQRLGGRPRGRARRPRQRHDDRRPQPPEPRPGHARDPRPALEGMFAAAGWQVIEAKYGRRLQAALRAARRRGAAPAHRRHGQRGVPDPHPAAGAGGPRAADRRRPSRVTATR